MKCSIDGRVDGRRPGRRLRDAASLKNKGMESVRTRRRPGKKDFSRKRVFTETQRLWRRWLKEI